MSFLDITDANKRDQIVADYVRTIHNIRDRNEQDKSQGLERKLELEQTFQPVVKATEKSTEEITKHLASLQPTPSTKPRKTWNNDGDFAVEFYLKKFPAAQRDRYFGIEIENQEAKMGKEIIDIMDDNSIKVEETEYKATPGLWRLIMMNDPTDYTEHDLETYKELLIQTEAFDNPHTHKGGAARTKKYKFIRELLAEKEGQGIFLPGDIKGLTSKLHLLLAEYREGNTTTRNEIVSISDELRRRKRMSRKEYTEINNFLQ